ncbi:MAG: hypothetical protein J07HQX50_02228 [Haloquadratum sp. J07HQX50]|nr:MAG: hypothetical protein J07HQX50_02228 [Haloquadratum sp. J07HQX50]
MLSAIFSLVSGFDSNNLAPFPQEANQITVVGNVAFFIRNGTCKLSFQLKLVWFRVYISVILPTTDKVR